MYCDLKEISEFALVILLGNEFQSEIECGTSEYKILLVCGIICVYALVLPHTKTGGKTF